MTSRKLRVLIAKPGLDGHDRGAKIVARALRDAGMEVIYTGLRQTPQTIVQAAIEEDVDAIGISILSGAHMTLFPAILDEMKDRGAGDILLFGGGIIPDDDKAELEKLGVARVFTPGAPTEAAIAGSSEVVKAVVVGTVTTVVVFLPLLWVKTEFTELYNDFALSIIFPLTASLLVAVTLIPMLGARLGRVEPGGYFDPDSGWIFLFDEAEKAHPAVWQSMLSLFDEGWIVDQRNVRAYGDRAIFILTSNAGQDLILANNKAPPGERLPLDQLKKAVEEHLVSYENESRQHPFSPEFMGRFTDVLIFNPLSKGAMHRIAEMRVVTTEGVTKTDDGGLWSAQEIAEAMKPGGILLPE